VQSNECWKTYAIIAMLVTAQSHQCWSSCAIISVFASGMRDLLLCTHRWGNLMPAALTYMKKPNTDITGVHCCNQFVYFLNIC